MTAPVLRPKVRRPKKRITETPNVKITKKPDKIEKKSNPPEKIERKQKLPRSDKIYNIGLIRAALYRLVIDNAENGRIGKRPTLDQLAAETGLHRDTVYKNLREIEFKPQQSEYRALTHDVLMAIFKSATSGAAFSQKLWVQLVEGWVEQKKIDVKPVGLDLDESIDPKTAREHYVGLLDE